jgi:hypothetical protein
MSSASAEAKPRETTEKPKRSAFIAAPPSVDTTGLRRVLERLGVRGFTADEVAVPGSALADVLREAIRGADIVVALVDGGAHSANVFYELGLARALDKRALVVVDSDEALPLVTSVGAPYLRTGLDNLQAIEFGVTQVLRAPHHGAGASPTGAKPTRPLGPRADELIERLRGDLGAHPERALQEIVLQALQESGVSAAFASSGTGPGAEIAVWSEDLEPWIANPLFIELRGALRDRGELDEALRQLSRSMTAAHVPWALLLYLRADVDGAGACPFPHILVLSAEEFLRSLRETGFGQVVRGLRDRRVHGVP